MRRSAACVNDRAMVDRHSSTVSISVSHACLLGTSTVLDID